MSADTNGARNPAVMLGIGLGVIALLAALWFLVLSPLLAGDEDVEPVPSAGGQQTEAPGGDIVDDPTEPGDEASAPDDLPVATYEIFLSRDPFAPVIAEDGTGSETGGDGSSDGDGSGDGNGGGDGNGNGGNGNGGNGNGGNGNGGNGNGGNGDDDPCQDDAAVQETVCADIVVELVTVDEDAQGPFVVVELTASSASPTTYGPLRAGDRFGPQDSVSGTPQFLVVSIFADSGCARLEFVDDPFQICQGDRVLK